MQEFEPHKLKFKIFDDSKDDLSGLDFTQNDGTDPLSVDYYVKNNLMQKTKNKSTDKIVYLVEFEKKSIAFFVLSTSIVRINNTNSHSKMGYERSIYPVLLMEKIGIDKNYRCFKIGKYICLFCLGLGQQTNNSLFIFKTTKSLAQKIYGPKYFFKWKNNDNDKLLWIYRRLR